MGRPAAKSSTVVTSTPNPGPSPLPRAESGRSNSTPLGGLHQLKVQGKTNTLQLSDVLAGEVWLCSGQSNMEMLVAPGRRRRSRQDRRSPDPHACRPAQSGRRAARQLPRHWRVCSREALTRNAIPGFSAAAYFFGRELRKRLDVPIGLIHTSHGNTPIEAWTSIEAKQAVPELRPLVKNLPYQYVKAPPQRLKADRPSGPVPEYLRPGVLYNGMIAPLRPAPSAAFSGTKASRTPAHRQPKLYGLQLRTMIAQWRQLLAGKAISLSSTYNCPTSTPSRRIPSETGRLAAHPRTTPPDAHLSQYRHGRHNRLGRSQ